MTVHFTVVGKAEPAGSKRAVPTNRNWRVVPGVRWQVLDANKDAEAWKKTVASAARGKMLSLRAKPFESAVEVRMRFVRARPKSHLLSDGVRLSAAGREFPMLTSKPDVLKLARAVEDAMTGIVYTDDALIVRELIEKEWGDSDEVWVAVYEASVDRTYETGETDGRG
jgi:crossover junction endodeoxyribonuclease RusA